MSDEARGIYFSKIKELNLYFSLLLTEPSDYGLYERLYDHSSNVFILISNLYSHHFVVDVFVLWCGKSESFKNSSFSSWESINVKTMNRPNAEQWFIIFEHLSRVYHWWSTTRLDQSAMNPKRFTAPSIGSQISRSLNCFWFWHFFQQWAAVCVNSCISHALEHVV